MFTDLLVLFSQSLPQSKTVTHTESRTVTVPAPSSTRPAEYPSPQPLSQSPEPKSAPTQIVEIIVDGDEALGPEETRIHEKDGVRSVTILRPIRPTARGRRWLW